MRIPVTGIESVSTVVFARTGSRYEKQSQYGLAHFLEHMVFKGTKLYPTTKDLSETVDSIGAQFNAFTGEEGTAFYIRSASKNLDLSLQVLGQLVTQALILPEEIEKERGVIFEEMHMYEDQPASYNSILFNQMFYAGSGLAHNILGETQTIKKTTQEDFQEFLKTWYGPDNLLIVVAGKKETVLANDLVDKITHSFIFEDRKAHPSQKNSWEKNFVYGERLHFEHRQTEQTHFILGWPGITSFDQRENVLALLSVIIGGNMSSRLFLQVREQRGLCYYINSQTDSFADAGFFGAAAGVNPEKLVEAVRVTVDQFKQLTTGEQAVTEAELIKAKNYLSGNLVLAQESTHNLALSYGMRYLLTDKVVEIEQRLKGIAAVSLAEVQALAAELIQPSSLRLSLIGQTNEQQQEAIRKIVLV
ncbi:MAG: pitrilysin family protein [bacterium]|nr:pitrilysin family protein [bacterium]